MTVSDKIVVFRLTATTQQIHQALRNKGLAWKRHLITTSVSQKSVMGLLF
jgi:hypothetical protein